MADEDDPPPALEMRLRFPMHLGDKRTGGVDGEKIAGLRLLRNGFGDAMRREDHGMSRRGFVELLDEDDAFCAQRVDHELVVHDLVPHVDRSPVDLKRPLDDLDGPHDACAEAARRTQDNPKGGLLPGGGRGLDGG